MKKQRKTVGLALGSGGIRGLAHVGVIKALVKNNIPIDYIAGSSIGAWVGAHYALFQDVKLLEEFTVEKQKEKFLCFIEPTMNGGMVKGHKMEKLLKTWLKEKTFADTKIPLKIVATDLITGNSVTLDQGSLAQAVRASMSIPTVFSPVPHDDQLLVDGGVSNPVPDNILREMGADIVISVNLDNYIKNDTFSQNTKKTLTKTATRSLNIMRYKLSQYSTTNSDIVLEPYTPAIGPWSFKKYFAKKIGANLVKNGEEETEKMIKKIKDLIK